MTEWIVIIINWLILIHSCFLSYKIHKRSIYLNEKQKRLIKASLENTIDYIIAQEKKYDSEDVVSVLKQIDVLIEKLNS